MTQVLSSGPPRYAGGLEDANHPGDFGHLRNWRRGEGRTWKVQGRSRKNDGVLDLRSGLFWRYS